MSQMSKVSKNNTIIRTEDGVTSVALHGTEIVWFGPGTIVLKHAGYKTATTRNRMTQVSNQFNLGFGIQQIKGAWFIIFKGHKIPFDNPTPVFLDRSAA